MKKFLLIFLFLASCVTNQNEIKNNISDIGYDENLTLEEFKIKLEVYALNKSYPNIDN